MKAETETKTETITQIMRRSREGEDRRQRFLMLLFFTDWQTFALRSSSSSTTGTAGKKGVSVP